MPLFRVDLASTSSPITRPTNTVQVKSIVTRPVIGLIGVSPFPIAKWPQEISTNRTAQSSSFGGSHRNIHRLPNADVPESRAMKARTIVVGRFYPAVVIVVWSSVIIYEFVLQTTIIWIFNLSNHTPWFFLTFLIAFLQCVCWYQLNIEPRMVMFLNKRWWPLKFNFFEELPVFVEFLMTFVQHFSPRLRIASICVPETEHKSNTCISQLLRTNFGTFLKGFIPVVDVDVSQGASAPSWNISTRGLWNS